MTAQFPKIVFWHGTLASLMVTMVAYGLHQSLGWLFWPDIAAQFSFAIVPGPIQSEMVIALGTDAKILGFYIAILLQIVAGGVIASIAPRAHWAHQMIAVGAFVTITMFAFRAVSVAVQLPPLPQLGLGLAFTSVAYPWACRLVQFAKTHPDATPKQHPMKRRSFIAATTTILGSAAIWPWIRSDLSGSQQATAIGRGIADPSLVEAVRQGAVTFDALPKIQPWLTPEESFYYISKNLTVPQVSLEEWNSLSLEGLVDEPIQWSFEEIQSLPNVTRYNTLECIDFDPHSVAAENLIGNGQWTGTALRHLLVQAGVQPTAIDLKLEAADGYVDSLPVRWVLERDDIMLVWALNGEQLADKHGYPVRLIVPGQYGMKNIKHLKRMVAVNEDILGYWQTRGWADDAPIKPFAKIQSLRTNDVVTVKQPVIVAGWAFAGLNSISAVEVSTSNGTTWEQAVLETERVPATWVRWASLWEPKIEGRFGIKARAIDGSGMVQSEVRARAFPSGIEGHHRVWVDVVSPPETNT